MMGVDVFLDWLQLDAAYGYPVLGAIAQLTQPQVTPRH